MLEQRIEELIAAVKSLTKAMEGRPMIVTPAPHLNPGMGAPYGALDPGFGHAPFTADPTAHHTPDQVAAGIKTPNEKPKSEDTTNTSQTSSPELPAATYDDVKRATNAVSKISREKAIAGLARFGVQSATKLAETQWAEYVAYMGKVAAGEIDPEASHV